MMKPPPPAAARFTPLSRQLLLRVLAFSLLLTVAATLLNGWISWRAESARQQAQLQAVLAAYGPGLGKAVWDLDEEAVRAQLSGLEHFPALLWAEVDAPQLRQTYLKAGGNLAQDSPVIRHPLFAPVGDQVIASWQLRMDHRTLLVEVWRSVRSFAILVALELLLQAVLLFWLAGRSVSVPLRALSRHVDELSVEQLDPPAPQPAGRQRNELHLLAEGITRLQTELRRQLAHRDAAALELQQQSDQLNRLLDQNAHQFDEVLQHMADGAGVIDTQANILVANPAWAALMGVASAAQLPGLTAPQWLHEPPWPPLLEQLQRQGVLAGCALRLLRDDGQQVPVEASFSVIDRNAQGQPLRIQVVLRDLTAQLETERRLIDAREAALSTAQAKSAFLANMSHEIRTPMNAIIGLTHLMLRDATEGTQHERLHKVDDAARHLLHIINDVLDLSKIDAGKMTLDETEFSLDELLSRTFEMVSSRAQDKGLELVLDTDHLPDHLLGDPTRLSQALLNLLANAVKFTEQGWVRLRGELLSEDEQGLYVRFEVQDTGEGIAPERQALLFTAFEQADGSTTRRHGGTGLGLALTRSLAELMHGQAGLHSVPGVGSTFWFTARLQRAPESALAAAPPTVTPLTQARALLVDDLPEARAALGDRLQMLGLQVDTLDNGVAALQQVPAETAAGRPYDVMLIDWRMSPLDGIETLQKLRDRLGERTPPSVLVTATDDDALRRQALQVHFDAVLVKPVTASALYDTLVRVLRGSGPAAPVKPAAASASETQLRQEHAGQRILLAEDNPINQEVAQELLRAAGLVVEAADNGASAVDMALTQPYDLVLMDLQMPVLDGLSATRQIRARLGPDLPVIAMTANAFGEDRALCLAAGMNDHVAKPVNPERLFATLLRWLPAHGAAPRLAGVDPAAAPPSATPPAPAAAPLADRLAAVEGFDVASGLKHVGGQISTLTRALNRFVSTYRHGAPELVHPGAIDNAQQWKDICHSLRGACGTIGATRLRQELMDFEQSLVAAPTDPGLATRAEQIHGELLALVQQLDAVLTR